MSFINDYSYTIRRSNKEIFYFYCDEGLFYKHYDSDNNLINKINIFDNSVKNFSFYNFSIDEDDNIYGILCFDNIKIIKCNNNSSDFFIEDTLNFDFQKFAISYPYIKKLPKGLHIFFYVYEIEEPNSSVLYHIYREDDFMIEKKIDFITHKMLDEYKLIWIDDIPIIFYFNMVDGFEEVFYSKFDIEAKAWSKPIQITNTKTEKIHLNVAYYDDRFHIAYCDKINDNYNINYLHTSLNEDVFSNEIAKSSLFMYPSFVIEDEVIYLMWVNFNKLYSSFSKDKGVTWSKEILDDNSVECEFLRNLFMSNYIEDISYNEKNLFIASDEISFLGF